ncbi:MAG: hypothetical protein COC05_07400 [Gammaproteobacteria bacterium]|nr:MAG: hypothetical protein COC05_07400 [Gammaproteobacteria bacterium]
MPYFNSKVEFYEFKLYDLKLESFGMFDVVVFPGVLYHLRYPFWSLRLIKSIVNDYGDLILETGVMLDDNEEAMLFCPTGAESPYNDPTSCTFFNLKGLKDTLFSLGFTTQNMELLHTPQYLDNPKAFNQPKALMQKLRFLLKQRMKKAAIDRATVVSKLMPEALDTDTFNWWEGLSPEKWGREQAVAEDPTWR